MYKILYLQIIVKDTISMESYDDRTLKRLNGIILNVFEYF